jgi:hypothetical protein
MHPVQPPAEPVYIANIYTRQPGTFNAWETSPSTYGNVDGAQSIVRRHGMQTGQQVRTTAVTID